jgi:hypothetical protein
VDCIEWQISHKEKENTMSQRVLSNNQVNELGLWLKLVDLMERYVASFPEFVQFPPAGDFRSENEMKLLIIEGPFGKPAKLYQVRLDGRKCRVYFTPFFAPYRQNPNSYGLTKLFLAEAIKSIQFQLDHEQDGPDED